MKINMSSPEITEDDWLAVQEVLSTRYLSLGPKAEEFEKELAFYSGNRYGVSVNSGTSGLHLAVVAAGIEEGDLVLTTPFSFVASANCILFERAIPVFVDIDLQTFNIDPGMVGQAAADLLQGGKAAEHWVPPKYRAEIGKICRLKALLPVDAFGQPADFDPLRRTAEEYGLVIIEDSCEALGSEYKGVPAGSLGDVGVFAFYPNKQMTTGEGGMLVTNNQEWADLFRSLRNQGRDIFDAWLNHTRLGFNYRMDEMSAALGLSQLGRLDDLIQRRTQVASWYSQRLRDLPGLVTPTISPTTTRMSWFVYVVRITGEVDRNLVMKKLLEQDIPSRPYFTPIHLQPFYQERFGYGRGDYPATETAGDQCLALPFSSIMTEDEVDLVASALNGILSH